MKQKDLAEEYAHKAFLKRNRSNPMSIHDLCFSVTDIKAAFDAGRESVVESMPELEWKDNDQAIEEEFAFCPVGRYEVIRWDELFEIWCNSLFLGYRPSLSEAKQAANEDYKKRIKQALGL